MCRKGSCQHCEHCQPIGEKRLAMLELDGLQLIEWYEKKEGSLTQYPDRKIAALLGWFPRKGGITEPTRVQEINGTGDGNRVRNVRRHVDRCRCYFKGFTFATKSNGSGPHTSRLHTSGADAGSSELDLHLGEVIARTAQSEKQRGSELERAKALLGEQKNTYINLGEIEKAFCCDHCQRDLDKYNAIQPDTVAEAQRLGIPIPRIPA